MDFDKLADRYLGATARQYNINRDHTEKWDREQAAIGGILATLARGSTLVDIPVGTGRFFELYARHGLRATGLDISPDMLEEARGNAKSAGLAIELRKSDIRRIDAGDGAFDTALCVRFMNWVDIAGLDVALSELARVSRRDLVCTIRHYAPVRDLELPTLRGARRLARQLYTRVKKRVTAKGLVYHEKREVHDLFAKHALDIVTAICIEQRRDGTNYFTYHLRKRR